MLIYKALFTYNLTNKQLFLLWFRCSVFWPHNFTTKFHSSYTEKQIIALVLARGGSKGVHLKNLQIIGGDSLLARSLKVIHCSGVFADVWVSTDHIGIAEEAFKCNTFLNYFFKFIILILLTLKMVQTSIYVPKVCPMIRPHRLHRFRSS